jgi:hypothetical protein
MLIFRFSILKSGNRISGSIPSGKWSDLTKLNTVMFNNNRLTGTLPPDFMLGLSGSLKT